MSWISENYEKATIGAAAVVALGLAFTGWQKLNSVEENFSSEAKGVGANNPAVANADRVSVAEASFKLNREWIKGEDEGRPVDLFTGVPLFVNKNDLSNPVDLPESGDVHAPIPNQWWIDNRIDPGFGDSPQRDADEDGFSNLEEFTAKTDPNDKRSYPNLVSKLKYSSDKAVQWVLRPGFEADGGSFTFEYSDTAGNANKTGAANPIAPGQLFFLEEPLKNRFKLIGSEKRKVMNEKIQVEVDVTFVKIEDQRPNKKGMTYEIPSQFRKQEARNYSHYDRTAVLRLNALGQEGQDIEVEEYTEFALPPGSPNKQYKLTEVTEDQITVEFKAEDGKTQTYKIGKGATGPETP
ncbi:Amuc_1099 family pilus-like system protein [Luteolibacter algae]|uniref:Amuc_1099 family pilus-like system protein n=1 Tax=Luteolibacter algae TaxID=454151 RepID=A0ABW5DA30_9BACT